MPNLVFKIAKFFNLLGANGTGPASNDSEHTAVKEGLSVAFEWLATFVGKLFETVYGWLVNLIWVVARLLLNLVDCLYILVQKLVGIDIYQNANWSELVTLEETDLIVKMLISDTVLEIFGKIALFSLILLFIFVIFSLIKSNYAAATSDSEVKVADVFKKVGKSLFLFLIIPFILVVGILGSNVILSSALNALKGNNDLSFGGMIFSASAYDANKYRIYAKEGVRVPITYAGTGELVNPKDYQTESDMRGLFYKIVNGDVKLDYVTKDKAYLSKEEAGEFSWVNEMDFNNAYISDANSHPKFDDSFNWFWDKYCDSKVLNDLKQSHDMIQGIYKTNWDDEQNVTKKTFDWDETYKEVGRGFRFPTEASVSIYENSDIYSEYENFATLQLEYFVMADFIDYAVQHYSEFYIVNSDNENVVWSDIVVNGELKNINEYSEEYAVFRTINGTYTVANGQAEIARENGNKSKMLSQNSFYVSYYNGVNRLYWTEDGLDGNYARSENSGATYIVCTKNEAGQYIPVTQTTTSFKSNFLNSNYGGPIVARGLFSSERFTFSGFDYERPTFINEITVGIDGNAVVDNTTTPKKYLFTDSTIKEGFSTSAISIYKGTIGSLFDSISGSMASSWLGKDFVSLSKENFENYLYSNNKIKTEKGEILLSDLYFNDDIAYYVETVDGENKYITFYDRDKTRMAFSKTYSDTITIANDEYEKETVNFSYIWDYEHGYELISDIDDISNRIDELSKAIEEFKNGTNGANTNMIFDIKSSLVINYSAELIKIQHGENTRYLLVGAKPENMQMGIDGTQTPFGSYKTVLSQPGNYSSESIEGNYYNTDSINKTESGVIEYKNLYIKGGKIYESNGKVFWEPSKTEELIETLPQTLSGIMNGKSFSYLYDTLKESPDLPISKDLLWVRGTRPEYVYDEDGNQVYDENGQPVIEDRPFEEPASFKSFMINVLNYADKNALSELMIGIYSNLTQNDILLGLASKVQNLNNSAYYNLSSRVESVDEDNNGSVDIDKDGEPMYQKFYDLTILNEHAQKLDTIKDVQSEAKSESFEIPIHVYEMDGKNNYIVFASVGQVADGYENSVHYKKSEWMLRCSANYTQYTGSEGTKNLGLIVSMNELIPPEGEGSKNALKIKNGGVYYKKAGTKETLLISTDSLRQYVANSAGEGKLVESALLINKDLYNNEYIYFIRDELRGTLATDINWGNLFNASPFRAKFMFAKFVQEEVSYRLQGGSFVLDYNFAEDVGIRDVCLYDLGKLNPLILVFATGVVFAMLWNCVYGLIERVLKIVILFIMMPITLSASTFDDNQRFGKWKDQMIENIFLAYTVLIMLNLYFALVPTLRTLTEGLVSWDDMPKAIQNMFASISVGGTNILSSIKNLGANIAGTIANGVTAVGNFISSISTNNLMLDNLTVSTEDASFETVLAASFLNEIIYVLFFLVFTSLVKGAKDVIGDFIFSSDLAKNGSDAKENVEGTLSDYKKSLPGQIVNKSIDLGNKAVRLAGAGVMGMGHKLSEGRIRRRINRASEETSNFTTNVDEIAEGGNDVLFTPPTSTTQTNVNTNAIINAMTGAAQSANATYITNINEEPRRTSAYVGRGSGLPDDEEEEGKKVIIKEVHSGGGGDSGTETVIIREGGGAYFENMSDESYEEEVYVVENLINDSIKNVESIEDIKKNISELQASLQKKFDEYQKAASGEDKNAKLDEFRDEEKAFKKQIKKLNILCEKEKANADNMVDASESDNVIISTSKEKKIKKATIEELNALLTESKVEKQKLESSLGKLIDNSEKAETLKVAAEKKVADAEKSLKTSIIDFEEQDTKLAELHQLKGVAAVKNAEFIEANSQACKAVAEIANLDAVSTAVNDEMQSRLKKQSFTELRSRIDELNNKKGEKTEAENFELMHLEKAEKAKEQELIEKYKSLTVLELENKIKELENKENLTTDDNEDLANIKKALDQKTEGGFRPGDGTQTSIEGIRANSKLVPLTRVKEEHVAQTGEGGSGKSADKVVVDEAEERLNTRIDRVIDATKESITGSTKNMNRRVNKVDANANARINETIEKTNVELRVRDADIVRTREKAEEAQSQIELIGQNSTTNVDSLANAVKDYSERVNEELKSKAYVSDVNATNKQLASEMEKGIKQVSKQNAIIDNELKLKALKDANKQKRKDFIKGPEKKKDDK